MTGYDSSRSTTMQSSSKPRIGIVSWDFLHAKGGMGLSMQWIAESVSADFGVVIGAPVGGELLASSFQLSGLLSFTKRFGGHTLFSLLLPFVLNHWVRKNRIDVLLMPGGPGGVFLWKKPRIPYICSVYHVYEQQARLVPGQKWKQIFMPLECSTYHGAAAVLSFNTDTRTVLEQIYRVPSKTIVSLEHAVDDAWKKKPVHGKTKHFCVCVARLEARKGVETLVDAWPMVVDTIPDARLLIIGQGNRAAVIDAKIAKNRGIVRIPSVLFPDLIEITQQAELSICPAYLEGFGLAAAEAMMTGTAVVAAESEGLQCLITDHQTGLLFHPGNAAHLAATIIMALKQERLRKEVTVTAQTKAGHLYDRTVASAALRHVINDIVTNVL